MRLMRVMRPAKADGAAMRLRWLVLAPLVAVVASCGGSGAVTLASTETSGVPANTNCIVWSDGRLITEQGGVRARDGECLNGADYARGTDADGFASPEVAVREHKHNGRHIARGGLTAEGASGTTAQVTLLEHEGERVVGRYVVDRLGDGTWLLHSFLASVPAT